MRKLFSKEIILYPALLLVSLFLLPNLVKADEIELNSSSISNDINTYINSDFNFVKDYLLNSSECSSNNYTHFTIFYYSGYYYAYCNSSSIYFYVDSNQIYYYLPPFDAIFYRYLKSSNTVSVVSSRPVPTLTLYNFKTNTMSYSSLLYDNSSEVFCSTNTCSKNNYYFYYLNNRIDFKEHQKFLSLYDLSLLSPVAPPDNTPVLTSFYTLIIDKFSVIADFFTDNIYLFALPLIPIFILCIYLIKRSLIK